MSTPIDISDAELDELMSELETEAASMIATANATPEQAAATALQPEPAAPWVESEPVAQAPIAQAVFTPEELAPVTPVAPPAIPVEAPAPEPTITADAKAAALAALKGAAAAPAPTPVVEQPAPTPAPVVPVTVAPAPMLEQVAPNEKDPTRSPLGLRYFVPAAQWQADTTVKETTLNENMTQQAGLRAFYGVQAAMAEEQHSKLKQRLELTEASLSDYYRRSFLTTGEKVTEKMIESAVRADDKYQKVKSLVIEAESIVNQNKAIVAAMGDRKDMLVQLGADRRNEMQGQLRVMEQQARENVVNDMKANALSAIRNN
jgi:hypothetical protein